MTFQGYAFTAANRLLFLHLIGVVGPSTTPIKWRNKRQFAAVQCIPLDCCGNTGVCVVHVCASEGKRGGVNAAVDMSVL